MKKLNAFILAFFGSLTIVSSVALVAKYFKKTKETPTSVEDFERKFEQEKKQYRKKDIQAETKVEQTKKRYTREKLKKRKKIKKDWTPPELDTDKMTEEEIAELEESLNFMQEEQDKESVEQLIAKPSEEPDIEVDIEE